MKRSLFLKLFPPPKYLLRPATGLDISDLSVKALSLGHKKDRLIPDFYREARLPSGLISYGEIKDETGLARELAKIAKEWKLNFVNVSLPEEKSYVVNLSISGVEEGELRDSIELQLADHIPIPPADAIFDFNVIGRPKQEEGGAWEVEVGVLPREIVLSYHRVLTEAGLKPLLFEMEGQSLARAMIPRGMPGAFILVDFGNTRTSFSIVLSGTVAYTSSINIGGEELTKSIMKDKQVSYEEALRKKETLGLSRPEKETLHLENRDSVFDSIISLVSVLADELGKRISYWQREHSKKEEAVVEVVLSGGDASLVGLPQFLNARVGLPVVLGNPWVNVLSLEEEVPDLSFDDALRYAPAIGLALANLD